MRHVRFLALWLAVLISITSPASAVETPCDALRAYLVRFARAHQEATTDTGSGEFLHAALHIKTVWFDAENTGGAACDWLGNYFKYSGIDVALASTLDAQEPTACAYPNSFYDERLYGGYMLLMQQDHMCANVYLFQKRGTSFALGPKACWSDLMMLSIGDHVYPASIGGPVVVDRSVDPSREINYRLHLYSGANLQELCKVHVDYQTHYAVKMWLGPKGKGDVPPEIQKAIEPILLKRAARQDAGPLLAKLRDKASGDSQYDRFVAGLSREPLRIKRSDPQSGDDPLDWLPTEVPFGDTLTAPLEQAEYHSYSLIDGDVVALRVNGRRLLLSYGTPYFSYHPLGEDGFGIWEWNGNDFTPIAGGYMERSGQNPKIE